MAASLALTGLFHGVERIPDKAFEKVPYVGPRYFQPKDCGQNQQDQDSNSEDERRSRRRSRREKRRAEGEKVNRGYDSDQGPTATYVPPSDDSAPPKGDPRNTFIPAPYNPAEYGAKPGTRDAYFAGHPQERQPTQFRPQTPYVQTNEQDPAHHSTAAERYVPNNYDTYKHETHARNTSPGRRRHSSAYASSPQPQALMVRPPQPGTLYPEYQPPEWDDDSGSRARRSASRQRDSRSKSRSRSRAGSRVREELRKHKDLASTSLGVLAGSIIGNQVTSRKGHSSAMGLVGGALLGGAIGHALEKGYEKEKEKEKRKKERRRRYSDSYDDY